MGFLDHEKSESDSLVRVPHGHDWADPEEPATCPIDRHVGEQLKYELKKQPIGSESGLAAGADL